MRVAFAIRSWDSIPAHFTFKVDDVAYDSMPAAGAVAVNVVEKFSMKLPLFEFFADA